MTTILLFAVLLILIFLSVPIGISIGLSTLFVIVFLSDNIPFTTYLQKAFTALDSFPLMAIPFFILAGLLMGDGGISKRLLNFADALIGFVVGGLAMVTIVACMFFSAISGSGPATVASIGSFMIPSMKEKKYGEGFSAAVTAAAGSIGVIIPPSIPFVLFGVVGSVSIGGLFLAGIIPGIIIGLSLMIASYLILRKRDIERPSETNRKIDLKYLWKTFWDAKWALLTPIVVLGGIYASVFTPTEASAIAILYGFIVGKYIHKELTWKNIYDSMVETLKMIGGILYMIGLSVTFAYVLNMERIPNKIADFILGISENEYIVMLLIIALLYVVGMFIDTISALVILTPILMPIVTQVGYDPIHFGVIMVISLAIGYVTPPVGTNLFVASQIGKVSFERVTMASFPFFVAMTLALILITFVPFLSMYLPSLMN